MYKIKKSQIKLLSIVSILIASLFLNQDLKLDSQHENCSNLLKIQPTRINDLDFQPSKEALWFLSNKSINKKIKIKNGNIKSTLKLSHWNLGSRHWVNKTNEIQHFVDTKKPDILIISEANIFLEDPDHQTLIPGYTLIKSAAINTMGYSRIAALVRQGIQVEIQHQLMCPNVASIWLKIIKKGGRKTYIGGIYREFSLMRQQLPNNTDDENQQLERWQIFIEQWCNASKLGDCYIIGDTNLDQFKWAQPDPINLNLVNLVKKRIEVLGYQQLVTLATRFWPSKNDSLIDHFWTCSPEKIIYNQNNSNGTADHNSLEVAIKIKGQIGSPVEVKKRSLKNFDTLRYTTTIENIDWTSLYNTENISIAANFFENNILQILNFEAPMQTIQIKNNHRTWVSVETRDLIKTRDTARDLAKNTQSLTDWNCYRKLRNRCTASLRTDKKISLQKIIQKNRTRT